MHITVTTVLSHLALLQQHAQCNSDGEHASVEVCTREANTYDIRAVLEVFQFCDKGLCSRTHHQMLSLNGQRVAGNPSLASFWV